MRIEEFSEWLERLPAMPAESEEHGARDCDFATASKRDAGKRRVMLH
jgi:hypothetical protein